MSFTRIFAFLVVTALAGPTAAPAETVRLTVYDDGLSCPGDCDAHVVFNQSMNGTEFAHSPATPASPFAPCVVGEKCRLCLESGNRQCLEATYRGGGPTHQTFDFTPRFYLAACATTPEQPVLATMCKDLEKAAAKLEGRHNCIAEPEKPACKAMMEQASAARKADREQFDQCQATGQRRYNQSRPPAQQRSLGCAYEAKGTGGPNSKGTTWKRLLPGACRDGTFVGRDGLDCCSGILFADGPLGSECRGFYPR